MSDRYTLAEVVERGAIIAVQCHDNIVYVVTYDLGEIWCVFTQEAYDYTYVLKETIRDSRLVPETSLALSLKLQNLGERLINRYIM